MFHSRRKISKDYPKIIAENDRKHSLRTRTEDVYIAGGIGVVTKIYTKQYSGETQSPVLNDLFLHDKLFV